MSYILQPSSRKEKKWMVTTPEGKTIHFGSVGYEDYNIHKNLQRYKNYISRHKSRENWGKSGINTAGFWARWILWNKPSITASIKDTQDRFNIKIVKRRK